MREWTPKDYEIRTLALPEQALDLLAAWQALAPEKCPYVFMDAGRWEYYRPRVDGGCWSSRDLVNNTLRRFKTLCRRAGVLPFKIHDMRSSCITNWARKLSIHVVQQLAGHGDINATRKYYLSVQAEESRKRRECKRRCWENSSRDD